VVGLYRGVAAEVLTTREVRSPAEFDTWVAPHVSAMHSFAVRLTSAGDAEDVVQDALLSAWRLRARFDPGRGSARTWLLTLVADQVRQQRRRSRRRPALQTGEPDCAVTDPRVDLDLRAAIRDLTERQQVAVAAYYYLDLAVEDVAAIMGCSAGTVKSTLADARARLRALLTEGDSDER